MTPERHQQIVELFHKVRGLEPTDCASFLNRTCQNDPPLRREVEELLAHQGDTLSVLAEPAFEDGLRVLAAEAVDDNTSATQPRQIGRYTILRKIGEGGMGIVFEAQQENPRRTVALKIIRSGPTSRHLLKRFQHEVDVLGQLQHLGIAQIYEATTAKTDLGMQPFFAMELIKGKPLADYANDQKLNNCQRLELLAKVCEAVHHAHQKGVIHRDLKPANILVTDAGQPKVLDFGVARVTDADVQTFTLQTETGQLLGTLPYMSPEQVSGNPAQVDIRSDVYALGVVLHELLTNQLPISVRGKTLPEVARAIREDEPRRLSAINTVFRGDVETIVTKAMEKDKERRYQSASDLAADIRRHLRDEPIEAKRDSATYLLRKNLRRYRWPLAIAVAFVLVLAGSSVVAWTLYAEAKARRAEAEQRTVELSQQRYYDQIRLAQASYEGGSMTNMRSVLDKCSPELRQWEWYYLNRLSDLSDSTLRGHTDDVFSMTFSPDSTRIVTASVDGAVKLWDVASGEELRTFTGHNGIVVDVKFGLDGTRIVSGAEDGYVRIWDTQTGEELQVLDGRRHGPVAAIAVSADGERIISAHSAGVIQVWDAKTKEPLDTLAGDGAGVHSVAFSPDGHLFFSGGARVTQLWDAESGLEVQCIPESHPIPHALAFDRAGRLISGGAGNTVKVLDLASGEAVRVFRGHTDTVHCVACSLDGRWIISGGDDRTVRVWSVDTSEVMWTLRGHAGGILCIAVSPDGQWIASAGNDKTFRIWHHPACEGGRDDFGSPLLTLRGGPGYSRGLAYAPNGQLHMLGDYSHGVWEPGTGDQIQLRYVEQPYALAVSPDGKQVAFGTAWPVDRTYDPPGHIIVHDTSTGEEVWGTGPLPDRTRAVAYNPDGRHIAASATDEAARNTGRYGLDIRNAASGMLVTRLRGHDGEVRSIAHDPSGMRIVSASADGTLIVWSVKTGEQQLVLRGHEAAVRCVRFGLDGNLIASAGDDGTCRLWDADSGHPLRRFSGHDGTVFTVAFHPSGKRLVTGGEDGAIIFWDVETGEAVLKLRAHGSPVRSISFSPDGTLLASGDLNGTIHMWETKKPGRDILKRRYVLAEARCVVDDLMEDMVTPTAVVRYLKDEGKCLSLSEPVRQAALALASCWGQNAAWLEQEAWSIVQTAPEQVDGPTDKEVETYGQALGLAEAACDVAPHNVVFRHTLGVVQYRVGRYGEAHETLRQTSQRRGEPQDFAFLAMVLHRLGRSEEARKQLADACDTLNKPEFEKQAHLHRCVREAELLIYPQHSTHEER